MITPQLKVKIVLIIMGLLMLSSTMLTSQTMLKEDYNRAVSFMYDNYNNKTVFNIHTDVKWFKDESGLWFIDYSENGKKYKTLSFKNSKVVDLFDNDKLITRLNGVLKTNITSKELDLTDIEKRNNREIEFNFKGEKFLLELDNYTITKVEKQKEEEKDKFEAESPDGKWIAFTKNYNLYVKSTKTQEEYQLSNDGVKNYEYGTYYGWYDILEGENGERPERFYVNWSNDSQFIATSLVDFRNAEKMYLLDYSIDTLYKPKLLSYYRGSPGDTNMVYIKPVIFDVKNKKVIKTSLPKNTHINSASVQWSNKPGVIYADYFERGFKKLYVKRIDLLKNNEQTIVEERSETNIDNFDFTVLEEHEKVLFLSERSGWRQLYLYDLKKDITTALTKGEFYINKISHIDKKKGIIYFLASGKTKGNNPYHQKLYAINLKGKMSLLTPEQTHHSVEFSKNGEYFVDNYSTVSTPTKTVLRAAKNGKILAQLTNADITKVMQNGWKAPEVFELTAKDGKTTIYGAFWKPTNFDASKKYPIIDAVYTGPHTYRFPTSFNQAFSNQSIAELGFIVMVVDGLGTSGRSKEFHNHSYKNMGNNLEDHVLAINYLGKKFPYVDASRVGIFGHSAGGFDTGRAMLAFPEVFKVGVASSADHDFRMEKAWWPEMYMGWPVDESYHEVSNITNAKKLKGKLLLVHGGIDENVNPSATFKLAEALINADKEFDLLILPSQRHGYQGKHRDYFIKKRWNYFIKNLLNKEPLWNFNWNNE